LTLKHVCSSHMHKYGGCMKNILVVVIMLLFACQTLLALEMTELIDCPTAGILQKGEAKFPINIFR